MNTEKQSGMQNTEPERLLNDIFETLGKDFVLALVENTKRARAKHPTFAYYEEQKLEILQEEYEEVRQAFYVPQDVASHAVGAQQEPRFFASDSK